MKQLLLSVIALVLTIAATGQTLKITTSSGTKDTSTLPSPGCRT